MSLYRTIIHLKTQLIELESLLGKVHDHPLMSLGLKKRIEVLNHDLDSLPKESFEPKVSLLFSGDAVIGGIGIKSGFVSKTASPFQDMVKTQTALVRFGSVGKRGKAKNSRSSELYLTALPKGSFGFELSQLTAAEVFDEIDVSTAMKQVISLIEQTALNDEAFEAVIESTPKRNLNNLKKLLYEISSERSILIMESGEIGVELTQEKVAEAYARVASINVVETEEIISGTFRGLLLDSSKFEIVDDGGKTISGFLSEDLPEDQLVEYEKTYINQRCKIHLRTHRTEFKTGTIKTDYELLEITSI
jgi:hypothetical protein